MKTIEDKMLLEYPVYKTISRDQLKIVHNESLHLEIKNFQIIEGKLFIALKVDEIAFNNYAVGIIENHLTISVAVKKTYNLAHLGKLGFLNGPLKTESTYFVMQKAVFELPGEDFKLLRTINYPGDKTVQIILSRN